MLKPTQEAIPSVSVIIPTYNRSRTLARAINSILFQSYSDLEVIVVDDGSTDQTEQLVAEISDPRVRYLRLGGNSGACRARNAGLKLARGSYIAFQDSDDEWLAGKLERQIAEVRKAELSEPAVCVFHTKIMYVSQGTHNNIGHKVLCVPELPEGLSKQDLVKAIHKDSLISTQTLLLNRAALDKVKCFDEALVNNNDWDFAIRLVENSYPVFIDEPLVMTYLQTDSISILNRRGARSQLRIALKLLRNDLADRRVVGAHLSRVGWWIAKLGYPRLGRRVLMRAISLCGDDLRTWARLGATHGLIAWSKFSARRVSLGQGTLRVGTRA